MTNTNYTELSSSDDCEKYINQFVQEFPLRSAEIGQGTVAHGVFWITPGLQCFRRERGWMLARIRILACRPSLG